MHTDPPYFATSIRIEYRVNERRMLGFTTHMSRVAMVVRNASPLKEGTKHVFSLNLVPGQPLAVVQGTVRLADEKGTVVEFSSEGEYASALEEIYKFIYVSLRDGLRSEVAKPRAHIKRVVELCALYEDEGDIQAAMDLLTQTHRERGHSLVLAESMVALWLRALEAEQDNPARAQLRRELQNILQGAQHEHSPTLDAARTTLLDEAAAPATLAQFTLSDDTSEMQGLDPQPGVVEKSPGDWTRQDMGATAQSDQAERELHMLGRLRQASARIQELALQLEAATHREEDARRHREDLATALHESQMNAHATEVLRSQTEASWTASLTQMRSFFEQMDQERLRQLQLLQQQLHERDADLQRSRLHRDQLAMDEAALERAKEQLMAARDELMRRESAWQSHQTKLNDDVADIANSSVAMAQERATLESMAQENRQERDLLTRAQTSMQAMEHETRERQVAFQQETAAYAAQVAKNNATLEREHALLAARSRELTERETEYNAQVEIFHHEREINEARLRQLQQQQHDRMAQMQQTAEQASSSQTHLQQQLRDANSKLQASTREYEGRLAQAQEKLQAITVQYEQQLADIRKSVQGTQAQQAEQTGRSAAQLESTRAQHEQQMDAARREFQAAQAEHERLVADMTTQARATQAEHERLVTDLTAQARATQAEHERLVTDLTAQARATQGKQERDLVEMRDQLRQLQAHVQHLDETRSKDQQVMAERETDIARLNEALANHKVSPADDEILTRQRQELAAEQQELARRRAEMEQTTRQTEQMRQELATEQQDLARRQGELRNTEEEAQQLHNNLAEERAAHAQEVEADRQTLESTRIELEKASEALKQERVNWQTAAAHMQAKLAAKAQALAQQAGGPVSGAGTSDNQLRADLEQAQKSAAEATQRAIANQTLAEAARKELAQAQSQLARLQQAAVHVTGHVAVSPAATGLSSPPPHAAAANVVPQKEAESGEVDIAFDALSATPSKSKSSAPPPPKARLNK